MGEFFCGMFFKKVDFFKTGLLAKIDLQCGRIEGEQKFQVMPACAATAAAADECCCLLHGYVRTTRA